MRTIRIDPHAESGVFEGWGTSLAWWADSLGRAPAEERGPLLRRLFGFADGGLGLTVVRFNAGGGENPALPGSMMSRARMQGYRSTPDAAFDTTADPGQRAVLREAAKLAAAEGRELTVEVFGNSPPWWATISGSVTGNSGLLGHAKPNLAPGCERAYARYLREVADFIERDAGVRVASISPFNEPTAGWWVYGGRQEGCRFSHAGIERLLLEVEALRDEEPDDRLISASEEWSFAQARRTWGALGPRARGVVGRLNTHAYAGRRRAAVRARAESAGVGLWMSEFGVRDATGYGLALGIVRDLRELAPSAWVLWQAVSPDDWGLFRSDARGRVVAENPSFAAFAHFTRSIRPGMTLVGTDDPRCVAAFGGGALAVVLVGGERSETVELDLGAFAAAPGEPPRALEIPARGVVSLTVPGTRRDDPGTLCASGTWRLESEDGVPLGERWRAEACGDGSVRLVDARSGRQLGVRFASRREGAPLRLCPAGLAEEANGRSRFDVIVAAGGIVLLRNRLSGLFVSRTDDGRIVQQAEGAPGTRWRPGRAN